MKDALLVITFLIYTIAFEALVWVGGFYVILEHGWSEWFVIVLLIVSGGQLKPDAWRTLFYNDLNEQ